MLEILAAGAAAIGATAVGYQTMAPTGQWFGDAFCRAPHPTKQIALTFDDGPNDPYTLKLLDVLSRHNVDATFFLIGKYVRQQPGIAKEIAARGHGVGNHTFTHPLLTFQSASTVRNEVLRCEEALNDAIGQHSNLFRPPWGGRRPGTFRTVRELGLEPVMWNITGYDWNASSAKFIQQKIFPKLRGGDVILLHDGSHKAFATDRSKTVEVVDRLLTHYKGEYEFTTIPEMMSASLRLRLE